MKAIIDNIRYDTAKAILVANWTNGCPSSNFNFVEESLYITKTGKWFLLYEGGPASKYAVKGNDYSRGTIGIRPFTVNDAYDFLEEHQLIDELEQYFPDEFADA
jgi:hypothetical protein